MSAYLPKDTANSFPYSDGGGLYALGLIHANHGDSIIEYLFTQLKAASSEVIKFIQTNNIFFKIHKQLKFFI